MKNNINTENFTNTSSKDSNTILQGLEIMDINDFINIEKSDLNFSNDDQNSKIVNTMDAIDINEDEWENTSEDMYQQKILNESWIKNNKYLNIYSLDILSFHNFENHCSHLESIDSKQTINNLSSKPSYFSFDTTKNLCRMGVQPNYMHDFLLKLFDIKNISKDEYDDIFLLTFKNHEPENLENYVPFFSGYSDFKGSLPNHFLNKEGVLQIKKLLWMINNLYPNINFCPIMIHLISLILIFCDEYETYEIMKKLIDQDININKGKTHKIKRLYFTYDENMEIINSIEQNLKSITTNKNVLEFYDYAEKNKFSLKNEFYQKLYFHFFFGVFNFYGLIRLLPLYLRDGIKSIYRLIYAIEILNAEKLPSIKNNFKIKTLISNIIKFCKNNKNIDLIFEESYKIKININIKNIKNDQYITEEPKNIPLNIVRNNYYLPKVTGGNILTDFQIIHLWEMLPPYYKIKNISLIYQASKDGYNLLTIIGLEEKFNKNTEIMFLIETEEEDKFGFIMSNLITHTDNKYFRPSTSYLFSICPYYQIYSAGDSEEILYVSTKHFIFGNGETGPAIQLNEDVKEGDSYGGGCFNNPSLVKDKSGHFIVRKIEIFKFK